jgi:lysyl-tRNA synthetase class II
MAKPGNPSLAQRFEQYIAGIELCNAYTADPLNPDQSTNFLGDDPFY